MKLRLISLDSIESFDKPCVLALGMFDGLHLGHQRVMKKAAEIAKKNNAVLGVLTFSPHPSKVINMGRPPVDMMFEGDSRVKLFESIGADYVFVKKFDKRFAGKSSDAFEKFLNKKFPNLRGLTTGENFLFGKNASGNIGTLAEMSKRNGWEYRAVKGLCLRGYGRMSSSLMRQSLCEGNLKLFKKIAGRPYFAEGEIKSGKQIGRTIGFPTLNLPWNPDCKPPFGVYAVELQRGNKTYFGVANYGVNPTVGKVSPVLETNLFENVRFGAGAKVKVSFFKFLRAEAKFENIDALKKQIAKDKNSAKRFFKLK